VHDLIAGDILGFGFVRRDKAMAQYVRREFFHIVGYHVTATVQEGAVKVTVGKEERDVAVGSGLMLTADSVLSIPTSAQMDEATKWVDGRLVIANRTLKDALPMFRRWYQMEMRPEVKLLDRTFSMSTRLDNADSATAALEQAAHVKRIWLKQQMVLVDAPAVPAPKPKPTQK